MIEMLVKSYQKIKHSINNNNNHYIEWGKNERSLL